MPDALTEADWLTPWAVAARYGSADASFDRERGLVLAKTAVAWAASSLDEK